MDLFELSAKIELNTDNYEESVKDATDKAEDLENALDGASESLNETEDAAEDTSRAFDNAEKKIDDTADAAKDAEKAVEDLGKTEKETSKETEGLGKSTEKTKESFFSSMVKADLFTNALSKAGEMALELAKYIWNLDEATEEYRVSQTKLNTAFKISGLGADAAETSFRNLYKAVGDIDRATEASQLLSQLARDTQDVSDWTEIATGVVGKFGDSLPIEALIEAANETSRTGKVVGVLADALNWAGTVGEDKFNTMLADCETQEERVELITQTLMGTYQDAAGVFEETSKTVMEARDAYLDIADAQAKTGEAVENLKATLTAEGKYTSTGFFTSFRGLVDSIGDAVNSMGGYSAELDDYFGSIETRLTSGNFDEAKAAFDDLKAGADAMADHPIWYMISHGGFFATQGQAAEIERLKGVAESVFNPVTESAEEATESTDNLTESMEELEEAAEPVIATAGDLAVQLEGTGYTAEEASARLKTYADAATDMFSQISTESELSYQDVLENLEHNWQATNDFANNMQSLAESLPPALYETFAAGGPQMYAGVVAMLAEANKGTDEGLTELNRQYELGGDAAMKAFLTSLGMVPENTQDPAKVIAAQMDEDTSMETASVSAVDRASNAMTDAVESAGFENSGKTAMDKFIQGMESKRSDIIRKAQSLVDDAKKNIDQGIQNIGSSYGGGSGRAGGLDYVPYNGYAATLHAGEAVLTAREAKAWRSGGLSTDNSRKIEINQYIQTIPQTPAQLAAATEAYFQQAVWSL